MKRLLKSNPDPTRPFNESGKKATKIKLTLDLRGRLIKQNDYQAIVRGPLVLARDSRFRDGFVDKTSVIQNENGFVTPVPSENKPENIWLALNALLVLGTDLEGEFQKPRQIHFCDFSSAGNTWGNKHSLQSLAV